MSLFLTNSGASLVLATGGIPVTQTSPLLAGVHPRLFMVPDGYTHAPSVTTVKARMASDLTVANAYIAYWNAQTWTPSGSIGHQYAMNLAFIAQTYDAGTFTYGGKTQADYRNAALAILRYYWNSKGAYIKVGDTVKITNASDSNVWMQGTVTQRHYATSINNTYIQGHCDLNVTNTNGSGTAADWLVTKPGDATFNTSNSHSYLSMTVGTGTKTFAMFNPCVGGYWDDSFPTNQAALAIVAADWLWDSLDADDKAALSVWTQIPASYSDLSDWVANSQYLVRYSARAMGKLLLYGEPNLPDTFADDAVAHWTNHMRGDANTVNNTGWSVANSTYGGDDGGIYQGYLYGMMYSLLPALATEEAGRTALGYSKSSHYGTSATNVYRYAPKWVNSSILPDANPRTSGAYPDNYKWSMYKYEYGTYSNPSGWSAFQVLENMNWIASLYSDVDSNMAGLARWLTEHRISTSPVPYNYCCPLWRWVIGTPAAAVTPTTAGEPVSKYSDRGWLTSRLTWGDTTPTINEPYVSIALQNYRLGALVFPGDIEVHRKGPMILRMGGANGHGVIGSPWGASAMRFPNRLYDHTTTGLDYENYGSTKMNATGGAAVTNLSTQVYGATGVHNAEGTLRTNLASGSRTVDYVLRDLTRHYSNNQTGGLDYCDNTPGARVSSVIREVVYFKPAAEGDRVRIFVHDTATALNKKYVPEVIWRLSAAPTIADGTTSSYSRGATGTDGHTKSTDATYVSWSNGSSDGYITILKAPASYVLRKTGGPNVASGLYLQGTGARPGAATDSHEYEDPYGFNVPDYGNYNDPGASTYKFLGFWHVEVADETYAPSDAAGTYPTEFCHAIDLVDTAGGRGTTGALAGVVDCVGGFIDDAVAVFATGGISQTSLAFRLETTGTFYVHLSRLNPSATRTITKGANITSIVNTVGGGTTYTASSAGELLLTVVVGTGGTGADNTITVS